MDTKLIIKEIYVSGNIINESTLKIINNSPKIASKKYESKNQSLFQKDFDGEWKKCKLIIYKLEFNNDLSKKIIKLIFDTHEQIKNIKTSNLDEDSQEYGLMIGFQHKIDSVVNALVNKFSYQCEEKDLFDFISVLLYRIIHAHAFNNGNKRTTLVSSANILKFFGFYIVWSSNFNKYIEEWQEFMLLIASSKENKECEDETIKKIKEKLLKTCWLYL